MGRLFPLNLIIFLGFMTVSLPLPVLPVFASTFLGSSSLSVGILVGLQSLTTVLSRPFAGRFVDRHGPRSSTLIGLAICTATGILYVISTMVTFHLAILLVGRITLGVGESLILTGAITWGIGRVGDQNSGQVMSWNGVAMYAALAAGAPLGLVSYQAFGESLNGLAAVGLITAVLPMTGALFAYRIAAVPRLLGNQVEIWPLLKSIWPFGLSLTLLMATYGFLASFYTLLFDQGKWQGSGWGYLGFGAAVILVRILFGKAPDRFGGKKVAIYSMLCAVAGQSVILISWTPAVAITGATLTGAGVALGFPALGIEAMSRVSASNRGMMVAIFSAFQDMAFGASGPLAGLIIVVCHCGSRAAFFLGALLPLLGILTLYNAKRLS